MNDILVLNLTRFGDLIQTTPQLRRLRAAYPQARITLVAQKRFSAVLPLMRDFDRVKLFDQDELYRLMAIDDNPVNGFAFLDRFMSELEQDHYDLVINLTAGRMSAYLVSLLNADQVAGITSADTGQRVISGAWGLYMYSFLLGDGRRYTRLNLVDIFSRMGGTEPDGMPVELFETDAGKRFAESFLAREVPPGTRLIGIQLGASESSRCWPAESFARLSDTLQASGDVRTVLLGSPAERSLADRVRSQMHRAPLDAVGRTNIEELFSLLRRCALLVTNDTGTMHFAAAGKTPVVMLAIGPASLFCTGPYSAGNLALQPALPCSPCRYTINCPNPVCRDMVPVSAVHGACRMLLGEQVELQPTFQGVRLYRSYFGTDGYLNWEALCNTDHDHEELSQRYTRLWKTALVPSPPPPGQSSPLLPELLSLTRQGLELTDQIEAASRQTPLPVERIVSLGEQEATVEAEIKALGVRIPAAAPLVDYLTLVRENITADEIQAVTAQTRALYEQGVLLASLL